MSCKYIYIYIYTFIRLEHCICPAGCDCLLFDLAVLMEPPAQPLRFAAAAPSRSSAQERRARKRRAEARVRLKLAADHRLLTEHHASQPPSLRHSPLAPMEQLLEAMLAQQHALFMCISGLYGWQAGSWTTGSHDATEGRRSGSTSGPCVDEPFSGTAADGKVEISEQFVVDVNDETSLSSVGPRVSDLSVVGERAEQSYPSSPASAGVGVSDGKKVTLCEPTKSGVGSLVALDLPISYQQFLSSDHYDYFRMDLTVAQQTYLDSFKHHGFRRDWRLLLVCTPSRCLIRKLRAPEARDLVMTNGFHVMAYLFLRLVQALRLHVITHCRCNDLGPLTVGGWFPHRPPEAWKSQGFVLPFARISKLYDFAMFL